MKLQGYELPARALAAALTHAAKDDLRHYMNGIFLDFPKGRIVGTDGHRMLIGQIPKADCAPVIVPRDVAEIIVKGAKKEIRNDSAVVVNVGDGEFPEVTINNALQGTSATGKAIDGKYPDYERVIPLIESDGSPGSYNARYLLDAQKALAIYTGRDGARAVFPMFQNGIDKAGLMSAESEPVFVIIMPMRVGKVNSSNLNWFFNRTTAKAA